MAQISRQVGTTSQVTLLFVQDSSSTTGAGLTGLAHNTGSLTAYYKRSNGTASVAITLANITTLGTFVSGGFKEVDATNMPGVYEFHPPNAALASGADSVAILLKGAANMAPCPLIIELTGTSNQDATAGGISRLDAAVSSRMATYTQPTGFLAATFPTTVASTTNITAGTITTVTTLTNLPSATTDWITAAAVSAAAVTKIQSGLSTYAGGDTSGTTTLLSRLTSTRAGYLDNLTNLDAAVSSRSTFDPTATGVHLTSAGLDLVVIESGINARQAMSAIMASAAGVLSGADTGSIVIKGGGVATTRITATTDSSGNRSAITLNLPS